MKFIKDFFASILAWLIAFIVEYLLSNLMAIAIRESLGMLYFAPFIYPLVTMVFVYVANRLVKQPSKTYTVVKVIFTLRNLVNLTNYFQLDYDTFAAIHILTFINIYLVIRIAIGKKNKSKV